MTSYTSCQGSQKPLGVSKFCKEMFEEIRYSGLRKISNPQFILSLMKTFLSSNRRVNF